MAPFRSLCCITRMDSSDRRAPMDGGVKATRAARGRTTPATVLGHPLRVRILEVLSERDLSPVEFCREGFALDDVEVSQVADHFRELAEYGCLEVVEGDKGRGSAERVYRGVGRAFFSDPSWSEVGAEAKALITKTVFEGLLSRVEGAFGG